MKKLITICVGLIVAGCATTTQLDEANAKIQDLEKRLAELEMKANLASRSPFVSHIPRLLAQSTAEEQKGSDGAPATNTIARTQSQPGNGAGGFISARRRREQREAEAAAEDKKRREVEAQREAAAASTARREAAAERDAEREEQRKQLLAIQEEIRRVRESKAAEMAKEDGREAEAAAKEEERKRAEAEKAAKEAEEKKAVDAKIDAFLKEHLGVQFGDSIDKFSGGEKNCRVIPVLKKFKYFNKAYGKFIDGKLYSVLICADIDEKFSVDSTREKIEQAFADLAVTLDLQSTAFNVTEGTMRLPQGYKNLSSYRIRKVDGRGWVMSWREAHRPNGFRRYGASITNSQLAFQLNAERQQAEEEARRKANATGETLPDPE